MTLDDLVADSTPPVLVADGTWLLPLGYPGTGIDYSLCYLLEDAAGQIHLIDPGSGTSENVHAIVSGLDRLGKGVQDLGSIVVTHGHVDHLGGARVLVDQFDLPLLLHEAEHASIRHGMAAQASATRDAEATARRWEVPSELVPDLTSYIAGRVEVPVAVTTDLTEGDVLPIPGRTVRVIHTPGHTPGHICLVDEDRRLLFTGDHLLPSTLSGIGLGHGSLGNPLTDYLGALDDLERFDGHLACPGHGAPFRAIIDRAAAVRAHHMRRAHLVATTLAANPEYSVWQVGAAVSWSTPWTSMRRFSLYSALTQIELHIRRLDADTRESAS